MTDFRGRRQTGCTAVQTNPGTSSRPARQSPLFAADRGDMTCPVHPHYNLVHDEGVPNPADRQLTTAVSEGYLYLQTHPDHPGLVRVLSARRQPTLGGSAKDGSIVRYLVYCGDVETARFHLHSALRRRLLDIDNQLYRSSLPVAIAAVVGGSLSYRQIWIDPALPQSDHDLIASLARRRRSRQRRIDRIWQTVGGIGIALMLINALVFF